MSIKIILADDHEIVRTGLRNLLEKEIDFEVIGEASNGREVIKLCNKLLPDIVILDIGMPELNGIEAAKQIKDKSPTTKIIALSMYSDNHYVIGMFKAGASGYILKDCAFDELIDAINTVMNKRIYISKDITGIVVNELINVLKEKDFQDTTELSNREKEVLQLIVEGNSIKEIAKKLFLSAKTIEAHRKNIMDKLDLHTIPELTKYAIRKGITSINS